MLIFSEQQVINYRMHRQMLTRGSKGHGQAGTLAALRIAQPARQRNRWLTAHMATPEDFREELSAETKIVEARFFRNTLGTVLHEDQGLYFDACSEECYVPYRFV